MLIAHVSDFHISPYGNLYEERRAPTREATGDGFETVEELSGWRVEIQPAADRTFVFRDLLRLVDEHDRVHLSSRVRGDDRKDRMDEMRDLVARRMAGHCDRLADDFPDEARVRQLMERDVDNANLRFCLLCHHLEELSPEWVVITGDLTEDAVGFELIERGLRRWIDAGRLLVIPGNHDIYPSIPLVTPKSERRSESEKRKRWGAFVERIGVPYGGCFIKELGEGVMLAGLDSCHPPAAPYSASGLIQSRDLDHLHGAMDHRKGRHEVRIVCQHHHLVNPPRTLTGSAPFQAGMRLRNAKDVVARYREMQLDMVLNGHRHMGYRYHPAKSPLFLSAPSTTLGCRTGLGPYFWLIEVEGGDVRGITDRHLDDLDPVVW